MNILNARGVALAAALALVAAACGGSDEDASESNTSPAQGAEEVTTTSGESSDDVDPAAENGAQPEAPSGGAGSGTIDVGGEVIEIDRVMCHLESQPAAAGGGNILFVVQGHGTDAAGEDVMIDISRYDEGSSFAGDHVDVVIGDIFSEDVRNVVAVVDEGTVTLDGSRAYASDVMATDYESFEDLSVSFDLSC